VVPLLLRIFTTAMGRVIGIDHGSRRTGLAVTDPGRIIATALDTVRTEDVFERLLAYVATEKVDGFVVGLPVNLDGSDTDATQGVRDFITALRYAFPGQWVETADERFTSSLAQDVLMASGKGRQARRDRSQLDRISATIILQGWLDRQKRKA
jgi:putative Holliday junction resolvase